MTTRGLVLGGGGVTGIAWEIGVLFGLAAADFDLHFDVVVGTSAGSFVGAELTAGADLSSLFDAQHRSAPAEPAVSVPKRLLASWIWAYLRGYGRPENIGAALGKIARRRAPIVDVEQRTRTVEGRLTTTEWPDVLRVTALNANTGRLRAFARSDGYALADVVAASGAVPGISPPVRLGDEEWIDGGMVSATNARLAAGLDEVLVLAPLPRNHGGVPHARAEVDLLSAHASAHLLVPDDASRSAIGPNIYDPARRPAVTDAGLAQGRAIAPQLF